MGKLQHGGFRNPSKDFLRTMLSTGGHMFSNQKLLKGSLKSVGAHLRKRRKQEDSFYKRQLKFRAFRYLLLL